MAQRVVITRKLCNFHSGATVCYSVEVGFCTRCDCWVCRLVVFVSEDGVALRCAINCYKNGFLLDGTLAHHCELFFSLCSDNSSK